ncbi:Caleosin-domain-containing protein [Cerioporus squamosus]|nr:Caleosin-domain-containing protein [Cerioporus squamosus]
MAMKLNDIQTAILEAPLTVERPVYNPTSEQNEVLPNPGTARVNRAPALDSPNGSTAWATAHAHQIRRPLDTFRAFRALGSNWLASVIAFVGLHAALSYVTVDDYLPDPRFRIYVRNVHKIKHGSDSGAYHNEGRFIPQNLEDSFMKYSSAPEKDSLMKADISNGLRGQRLLADLFGRLAAYATCKLCSILVDFRLHLVDPSDPREVGPKDGKLTKEDVRRLFEGRLFYEIAERNAKAAAADKKDD